MKRFIKEFLFRKWYWYVSKADKNADVIFMNFGYWYDDKQIALEQEDEKNRVSIQLYHKLTSLIDIEKSDICEVGSGRGGGLAYIHEKFNPKSSVGLDLNKTAVNFCKDFYNIDGLSFIQGDAQNLPLKNDEFDVIINTESSHRYPEFDSFLNEAHRCLKPEGHLLLTDFRYANDIESMEGDIKNSEFEVLHYEDISKNVINALIADDTRRRNLVKELVPSLLQKTALNFAGVKGTDTFNKFCNRKYIYFLYILKKV